MPLKTIVASGSPNLLSIKEKGRMSSMSLTRRAVLKGVAAAGALPSLPVLLRAQPGPVRIGELNSYSRMAAFAGPYRNGMQLALEEINAKGGVLGGRKLEIVFRDDGATPGDAVAGRRGAGDARERRPSWPARSSPMSASRWPISPTSAKRCSSPPSR